MRRVLQWGVTRASLVGVWLLLVGLGTAAPVAAQSGDTSAYDRAVRLGLQEFGLGNYLEARARFLEAHREKPSARTLRALGKVEYELKDYAKAVAYLERALSSRVRPLESAQREEVADLLRRAQGYVGQLVVSLQPPDATLRVDGLRMELPADGVLSLAVGPHVIEASAPGLRPMEHQVELVGGDRVRVRLALEPESPASPRAAPAAALTGARADDRADSTPFFEQWWVWTVAGVLVAGVAVGTVLALDHGSRTEGPPMTSLEEVGDVQLSPRWAP